MGGWYNVCVCVSVCVCELRSKQCLWDAFTCVVYVCRHVSVCAHCKQCMGCVYVCCLYVHTYVCVQQAVRVRCCLHVLFMC